MNEIEYLLTCLQEEASEIIHRVAKAKRFGLKEVQEGQDKTNEQRIAEEIMDLEYIVGMLVGKEVFSELRTKASWCENEAKKEKFNRYLNLSRTVGILRD